MAQVAQHPVVTTPVSGPLAVRLKRLGEIVRQVLRNPVTVIGLLIIVLIIAMALLAPVITTPNQPNPYQMPRDWARSMSRRGPRATRSGRRPMEVTSSTA